MRLPVLLLAAAALVSCDRSPAVAYRTETTTRGPVHEVVSATGEVSAVVTVTVGSQVSGTVSRLFVDFNSRVRKGDVLADLDPRLFEAALARGEAGLAAAEAEVERAKVTLAEAERAERRTLELARRQNASEAEVQTAESSRAGAAAALRAAQARVMQARAERDTARTNLALARIRSPIDGVVISRNVDVGQTVAAAFQAPTLFTIANDLSRMQVLAHVDEADVGKVRAGLRARFSVDAYPGENFEGTIREVRQAPTTIQNVVTYAAVIDAANPEHKLRQGMTAQVSVVTTERADAIRVPNAALRYRPQGDGAGRGGGAGGRGAGEGGERRAVSQARAAEPGAPATAGRADVAAAPGDATAERRPPGGTAETGARGRETRVFKLQDGKPSPVEVRVGITDGRQTEVISGLGEGEAVVVGDTAPGQPAPSFGPRRGPF